MEISEYIKNSIIDIEEYSLSLKGQIPRNDYVKVNEILMRLGGKWVSNRKKHYFQIDPTPLITSYLKSGVIPDKNPTAFFPTPKALAETILRLSDFNFIGDYDDAYQAKINVLEPSGGVGGLVDAIIDIAPNVNLDTIEILDINQEVLRQKGYSPICMDFMQYNKNYTENSYDYVIMNPPFSLKNDRTAYITHIMHAFQMLKPSGTLAAIIPVGFLNNSSKKENDFLELVALNGEIYKNPTNSFKDSGTLVETISLVLHKELKWREKEYQSYTNYYVWLLCLQITNDYHHAESFYKECEKSFFVENKNQTLRSFIEDKIIKLKEEDVLIPKKYMNLYVDAFMKLGVEHRENLCLNTEEKRESKSIMCNTHETLNTFAQGTLF